MAARRSWNRLPPRDLAFLDTNGLIRLEWYEALQGIVQALGGTGTDRVVRSPATGGTANPGPTTVVNATGTVAITVDGVEYQVVYE